MKHPPLTTLMLDCLTDLLGDLRSASVAGVLEGLLKAAAGTVVGTAIGTPPALAAVLATSLLGYAGLRWLTGRRAAPDDRGLQDLLRSLLDTTEAGNERIRASLVEFELDLASGLKSFQSSLTTIQQVLQAARDRSDLAVELLEKHEGLYVSLEGFILQNFGEVLRAVAIVGVDISELRRIIDRQPPLTLRQLAVDDTRADQMLLFYGYRRLPLYGRQGEVERLLAFARDDSRFSWWILTGPGGVGKSRLALEVCLQLRAEQTVGFLTADTSYDGWDTWQPRRPTLVVVDYVAFRPAQIGRIMRILARRASDLAWPVHVLLIERDSDGKWVDELLGTGGDAESLKAAKYHSVDANIALSGLSDDEIWSIVEWFTTSTGIPSPERDPTIHALRRIDPVGRPLFAAMAGDAIARRDDVRRWDEERLLRAVLQRERARWDAIVSDRPLRECHVNLLAIATMLGGLRAATFGKIMESGASGVLPKPPRASVHSQLAGQVQTDQWPPLEPDVLGEFFVLEHLKPGSDWQTYSGCFADAAWQADGIATAQFLIRAAHDFPHHPASPVLCVLSHGDTAAGRELWSEVAPMLVHVYAQQKAIAAVDRVCDELQSMAEAKPERKASALLERSIARNEANDTEGAIADCDTVIAMLDVPPNAKAVALANRGAGKLQRGDFLGGIADCDAAIEMPNIDAERRANALLNRASCRFSQGDLPGAAADCAAVIALEGVPGAQKAASFLVRGQIAAAQADIEGARRDFGAAIEHPGVLRKHRAGALLHRAAAGGATGDRQGIVADCDDLLRMQSLTAVERGGALSLRAEARSHTGDQSGAILDATEVIEMRDVPSQFVAKALLARYQARSALGEADGALGDCEAIVGMADVPLHIHACALIAIGDDHARRGDVAEAERAYTDVIERTGVEASLVLQARVRRGSVRLARGAFDFALSDLDAAMRDPDGDRCELLNAQANRACVRIQLGDLDGARHDCEAVLSATEAGPDHRATALVCRSQIRCRNGQSEDQLRDLEEALALPAISGRPRAAALVSHADAMWWNGRFADCEADCGEALTLAASFPDVKASALLRRAGVRMLRGALDDAAADLDAASLISDAPQHVADEILALRATLETGRTLAARAATPGSVDTGGALAASLAGNLQKVAPRTKETHPDPAPGTDLDAAIDNTHIPPWLKASLLCKRAAIRGQAGDHQGALADATAVLAIPAAAPERQAHALVIRASARNALGEPALAMADCLKVVEMADATPTMKANALVLLGGARTLAGRPWDAISDIGRALNLPGVDPGARAFAFSARAGARALVGHRFGAIADARAALAIPAIDHDARRRALKILAHFGSGPGRPTPAL